MNLMENKNAKTVFRRENVHENTSYYSTRASVV